MSRATLQLDPGLARPPRPSRPLHAMTHARTRARALLAGAPLRARRAEPARARARAIPAGNGFRRKDFPRAVERGPGLLVRRAPARATPPEAGAAVARNLQGGARRRPMP